MNEYTAVVANAIDRLAVFGSAATDVAIGFGSPLEEVVDLNFQSGPDPSVPARLHRVSA